MIETVDTPELAEGLIHPVRRQILSEARRPVSAIEVARRLGQPRQRINYHVQELVRLGLLVAAGEVRRRGLTERLYRTRAEHFALSPDLLGPLTPEPETVPDRASVLHLVALTCRTQRELGAITRAADKAGQKVPTLSLDVTVHFPSPAERAAFAEALTQAVADVVSRFSHPTDGPAYRVVLGSYPKPKAEHA